MSEFLHPAFFKQYKFLNPNTMPPAKGLLGRPSDYSDIPDEIITEAWIRTLELRIKFRQFLRNQINDSQTLNSLEAFLNIAYIRPSKLYKQYLTSKDTNERYEEFLFIILPEGVLEELKSTNLFLYETLEKLLLSFLGMEGIES